MGFTPEPSQYSVDYICEQPWHGVADTHVEGWLAQMGVRLNTVMGNRWSPERRKLKARTPAMSRWLAANTMELMPTEIPETIPA